MQVNIITRTRRRIYFQRTDVTAYYHARGFVENFAELRVYQGYEGRSIVQTGKGISLSVNKPILTYANHIQCMTIGVY